MAQVLLVDDHIDLRDVVTQLLEIHGHRVEYCGSAEEAMILIDRGIPDAIILDQRLPDMSGLELLTYLRNRLNQVSLPIIVYSADDTDSEQFKSAGANDFWLKGSDRLFEGIEQLGRQLNALR